jgi:hypothetical protein
MAIHRRRLPHDYPPAKWLFLTWNLHGSLPPSHFPPPSKCSSGEAFVWIDRFLDQAAHGPLHLRQPRIAAIVLESFHTGVTLGHFDLGPYVVMANHVHAVLLPRIHPSRLMQAMKGSTARVANRILGLTGQPFWQEESYDHWVRDDREFARIAAYIENNPVRAGLVQRPGDYRWSSAHSCAGLDSSVEAAGTTASATNPAAP